MDNNGYHSSSDGQVVHTSTSMHLEHTEAQEASQLQRCSRCCNCCLRDLHPLPENPLCSQKCHHAFLCPPFGQLGAVYTFAIAAILLWSSLWALLGNDALPGGNIFGLVILFIGAIVGGNIVEKILPMPPLLGMLQLNSVLNFACW